MALLLATAVLGSSLGVAWAGQTFLDVPPSHSFFDEIEAISTAGITTGFSDGTYRPSGNVTRGAMAAFMGRGFGRVGASSPGAIVAEPVTGFRSMSNPVTLTAGATTSGGGFVLVTAVAVGSDAGSGSGELQIRVTDGTSFSDVQSTQLEFADVPGTGIDQTLSVVWLDTISADETATYTLQADVVGGSNANYAFDAELTAVYVPFDGTGNA